MQKRTCCFIPEDQQSAAKEGTPVPGCKNLAEWVVNFGETPDDYTESCATHLEEMKADYPREGMRVWPIKPDTVEVYVILSEPGPHQEFVEIEDAEGRSIAIKPTQEKYSGRDGLWRIGPLVAQVA